MLSSPVQTWKSQIALITANERKTRHQTIKHLILQCLNLHFLNRFSSAEGQGTPKMSPVTSLTDLNKDSIEKVLQDFYKDPNLKVTQVQAYKVLGSLILMVEGRWYKN